MRVDEWGGQVLLAWVDIEGESEEAMTGGAARIICRRVWEETSERGKRELRKTTTKCKVLVTQRR